MSKMDSTIIYYSSTYTYKEKKNIFVIIDNVLSQVQMVVHD